VKIAHTGLEDMHGCLVCKAHKTDFLHCSTVIKFVDYFGLYSIIACLAGISQKKKIITETTCDRTEFGGVGEERQQKRASRLNI